MLSHEVSRSLNVRLERCVMCLLDPVKFFKTSRYTYTALKLEDGYEIVFKWVKWGITRHYRVKLKVHRSDNVISYVSTPDSDYEFRMSFTLTPTSEGTKIFLRAWMKAGLMADLLGRRDYARFVEELIDSGITTVLSEVASSATKPSREVPGKIECVTCLLYEHSKHYCYYIREVVKDVTKPPCKGRAYLRGE